MCCSKAMGKKQKAVLAKMKPKFIDQAAEKGHDKEVLEKIWHDWEAFAAYAFNKSHSTCYAWVAYQTAYLKANYPSEYMAAVLSNNMNDIKDITFYMEEARRLGIRILCPDVNESKRKFSVTKQGDIRFGLGAVKNVGENAISFILKDRAENGPYTSLFDFTTRVDKSAWFAPLDRAFRPFRSLRLLWVEPFPVFRSGGKERHDRQSGPLRRGGTGLSARVRSPRFLGTRATKRSAWSRPISLRARSGPIWTNSNANAMWWGCSSRPIRWTATAACWTITVP